MKRRSRWCQLLRELSSCWKKADCPIEMHLWNAKWLCDLAGTPLPVQGIFAKKSGTTLNRRLLLTNKGRFLFGRVRLKRFDFEHLPNTVRERHRRSFAVWSKAQKSVSKSTFRRRVRQQVVIFWALTGFDELAMQSPIGQIWLSAEISLQEHV